MEDYQTAYSQNNGFTAGSTGVQNTRQRRHHVARRAATMSSTIHPSGYFSQNAMRAPWAKLHQAVSPSNLSSSCPIAARGTTTLIAELGLRPAIEELGQAERALTPGISFSIPPRRLGFHVLDASALLDFPLDAVLPQFSRELAGYEPKQNDSGSATHKWTVGSALMGKRDYWAGRPSHSPPYRQTRRPPVINAPAIALVGIKHHRHRLQC
ncbi:hypothetical protein C8R45DRAFT_918266 [Mycena sanguinolenta]|nr:hypothetical protein C8R45DRAFT_918266 [Mycena sanguinolenta]